MLNPPSTKPSVLLGSTLSDVLGNSLLTFGGALPAIAATSPAKIILQDLKLDNSLQGATTGATITFGTIN